MGVVSGLAGLTAPIRRGAADPPRPVSAPVSGILTGSATGLALAIVSAGLMADLVGRRWFRALAVAAAWLAWRCVG
jgi:hypothetical protein